MFVSLNPEFGKLRRHMDGCECVLHADVPLVENNIFNDDNFATTNVRSVIRALLMCEITWNIFHWEHGNFECLSPLG